MSKPTEWVCTNLDSIQPGHPSILIRVFAVLSVGNYMQTRYTDQTELMHRLTVFFTSLLILHRTWLLISVPHFRSSSEYLLCILGNFLSSDFVKSAFSKKVFQEYHQSVKQFGSRSRQSMWLSVQIWVQSACKDINRRQKSPLARNIVKQKNLIG